jgi:hypothetical protein
MKKRQSSSHPCQLYLTSVLYECRTESIEHTTINKIITWVQYYKPFLFVIVTQTSPSLISTSRAVVGLFLSG